METELFKVAVSQGIFAALFIFLFVWMLKDSKEIRKEMKESNLKLDKQYQEKINQIMLNYQETIKDLVKNDETIKQIKTDVKEIQEDIAEIKTDVAKIKGDVQDIRVTVHHNKNKGV